MIPGSIVNYAEIAGLMFVAYMAGWAIGWLVRRLTLRAPKAAAIPADRLAAAKGELAAIDEPVKSAAVADAAPTAADAVIAAAVAATADAAPPAPIAGAETNEVLPQAAAAEPADVAQPAPVAAVEMNGVLQPAAAVVAEPVAPTAEVVAAPAAPAEPETTAIVETAAAPVPDAPASEIPAPAAVVAAMPASVAGQAFDGEIRGRAAAHYAPPKPAVVLLAETQAAPVAAEAVATVQVVAALEPVSPEPTPKRATIEPMLAEPAAIEPDPVDKVAPAIAAAFEAVIAAVNAANPPKPEVATPEPEAPGLAAADSGAAKTVEPMAEPAIIEPVAPAPAFELVPEPEAAPRPAFELEIEAEPVAHEAEPEFELAAAPPPDPADEPQLQLVQELEPELEPVDEITPLLNAALQQPAERALAQSRPPAAPEPETPPDPAFIETLEEGLGLDDALLASVAGGLLLDPAAPDAELAGDAEPPAPAEPVAEAEPAPDAEPAPAAEPEPMPAAEPEPVPVAAVPEPPPASPRSSWPEGDRPRPVAAANFVLPKGPPRPVAPPPVPAPEPPAPTPPAPAPVVEETDEDAAMRAIEGSPLRSVAQPPELADVSAAVNAAQVAVESVLARSIGEALASDLGKPRALLRARGGQRDNLRQITGLSALDEATLNNLGIFHFDQIGGWDQREVLWLENHAFARGRIGRERWQEQARALLLSREGLRATR